MSEVRIASFHPRHAAAFRQLNIDWMERYGKFHLQELSLLDHPQAHIIDTGGAVFLALLDGEVIGTCCLLKRGRQRFELAKMCVARDAQRRGIGERLARHAIASAASRGAKLLCLRTASELTAAIALYRKLGFVESPCNTTKSVRCDIEMELRLQPAN